VFYRKWLNLGLTSFKTTPNYKLWRDTKENREKFREILLKHKKERVKLITKGSGY